MQIYKEDGWEYLIQLAGKTTLLFAATACFVAYRAKDIERRACYGTSVRWAWIGVLLLAICAVMCSAVAADYSTGIHLEVIMMNFEQPMQLSAC